jgi:hypothetical protein
VIRSPRRRSEARSGRATWAPILDGALASRALDAVREIAAALRDGRPAGEHASALAGGAAGLAVCYAYLGRAGVVDAATEVADELLDEAVDALAEISMSPSLYQGFTGVAWAHAHLRGAPARRGDESDPHEEVDAALGRYLKRSPWTDDYDLVSGLVGIGVYARERLPRRSARTLLALVIERLGEAAVRTRAGTTWLTRPGLLPPDQRETAPHGHYNFGVAHGVPGVIALLGGARASGVVPAKTQRLLDGSVRWLLENRLPGDAGSTFPFWAGRGVERRPARSAWCYGDPGIAAALLAAARGAGSPSWKRAALTIARRAAARPAADAGIHDPGLCHGAAGLGHLFNRMYQATGESQLAEAARFWFARTLEMRRPGHGVAGFAAYSPRDDRTPGWTDNAGLLTGAAGIALALLAASTPIEPAWDRLLLAS